MKISWRQLYAVWLIIGGVSAATPCLANTAVTLKPEVETSRFAVRLSDLFGGVPAEIDREIAQAPAPCKTAVYTEAVLNKLADMYRLDWQSQTAADHAIVTSACTRITGDMIRDAVIEKVKKDGDPANRNYEIVFDTRNLEIDLPADQAPNFVLNNFSYDAVDRHFHADLAASTLRGPYVLPITGHIQVKRPVPVLAHRVEAGTTLAEADFDFIQVPEERITADIVSEPSQLIGRELRHDTSQGEMIHSHDIIPPRLVTRGSLVTMKIETPLMSVTTQGKAEQDGGQGDVIRVTNTQSNRIVEGVVKGPGLVEIRMTQRLASAQ